LAHSVGAACCYRRSSVVCLSVCHSSEPCKKTVKLIEIIVRPYVRSNNKNSSGDEIANVNFFYNIAHVEASAYAH